MKLARDATELLQRYDWPGNVRELRNVLERTLVLTDRNEITAGDLPGEIRNGTAKVAEPGAREEAPS